MNAMGVFASSRAAVLHFKNDQSSRPVSRSKFWRKAIPAWDASGKTPSRPVPCGKTIRMPSEAIPLLFAEALKELSLPFSFRLQDCSSTRVIATGGFASSHG